MAYREKHAAPASSPTPFFLITLFIGLVIIAFALGYIHHQRSAWPRNSGAAPASFSQRVMQMPGGSAATELFVVGSLAPLGSFDYETSPVLTRLAVLDRHADGALKRHEISHDQAAEVLAKGDSVYAVIAQATRFCNPAAHSGKCRRDHRKAEQLLEQAKREVQTIPDYAPGVSYSAQ